MNKKIFVVMLLGIFMLSLGSATLSEGLISYYKLDGTSEAVVDSIGNNSGTNQGATRGVTGKINNAFDFEKGESDYVNVNFSNELPNGAFTVSAWVNLESIPSGSYENYDIVTQLDGSYNGFELGIFKNDADADKNYLNFYIQGSSLKLTRYQQNMNIGTWYHILATYNGSGTELYFNGASVKTETTSVGIGARTEDLIIGSSKGTNRFLDGIIDEVGIWSRALDSSEVATLYNSSSGNSYPFENVTVPEVETTLYAPADDSLLSDVGANFTTIHTPTEMNLTNATYIIWKLNGGSYNLFNSTNISLSGNETINSTLFIDSFTLGKYKWNTQTCGENSTGFVDCSFAPANYSYEVGASILNETYNAITYETTSETFTTTVSVLEDIILYDSKLNYNGTVYTGTITSLGNNTYNLSKTINVPVVSVNENMTFYWEMSYDNGGTITTQDLTEYNQTVLDSSAISITSSSCPAGFFETINYTFKDAENLSSLTANVNYNYKYGIGNLSGLKIFGEFNDITSFRVCINDSISDYKLGYGEIQYSLTGYSDRRFYSYYNQSLSNETTREYELLSLQNADSTSFIFEVKNTFLNPYTNKFISLLRWYPETDEYKVVETALTDTDGKTVMKVKTEDVNYRVGVYEQNGTLIKLADSVRMACLVDPCTYTLRIIHDPQDYYSIYDVESSLTFDEDNNRFLYIWNDPEQITSAMRLEVFKVTGNQDILICNETTSSYTGVMICSIGNYTGDFYAKVYRSAFPEKIISTLYYTIRTGVESSFGLFLSVIFTLLTGLIGIFSPVGAIVMLVMGLLPALLFGAINLAIFMGIATLGGIIIHYLLKKGNN